MSHYIRKQIKWIAEDQIADCDEASRVTREFLSRLESIQGSALDDEIAQTLHDVDNFLSAVERIRENAHQDAANAYADWRVANG